MSNAHKVKNREKLIAIVFKRNSYRQKSKGKKQRNSTKNKAKKIQEQ